MIRTLWNNPARKQTEPEQLPFLTPPEWTADARCAPLGPEDWDALDVAGQVAWCRPCPVVGVCREYGIEQVGVMDKSGTVVYGGLAPKQIVRSARARRKSEGEGE